ncbi:hypothetical protein F3F96_04865 [Mariprofundus sp. NF]|uniref:bacteriohemerythrin n=1 Tax=Mariprofundus sp. NF TaxID=2608716 RepID=UPI0015A1A8EE|nr:hemerythrin family protein [Mariprofundus sp. NF]NWF38460.1 hypothetical protein [Mariprofundus sp. NF]
MKLSASDFPEVPLLEMHDVHLQEVEMINAIYDLILEIESGNRKKAVLSEKLDELLIHTQEHFANEERLMLEAHFPPYAMHKNAHNLFLQELQDAVSSWKEEQAIGPIDQFMRFKLPRWMKDHISTMDYVTAGYLANQLQK